MPSNPGKAFEADFRKSVPPGVYAYRLKDAGGWAQASELRFTPRNDYDLILYRRPVLLTLELKSVGEGRWSFDSLRENQRVGLLRARANGAVSGVVLNFRKTGETFFIRIDHLLGWQEECGKKSVNLADARRIGIPITHEKVRTRWRYDIAGFLDEFP